jgi:hypothetical protein
MPRTHNQQPSIMCHCVRCRKPFRAYHSNLARGRGKFCSRACCDATWHDFAQAYASRPVNYVPSPA